MVRNESRLTPTHLGEEVIYMNSKKETKPKLRIAARKLKLRQPVLLKHWKVT